MATSADKLTKEERLKILGIDKLIRHDQKFESFDNLADADDKDVRLTMATSKLLSKLTLAVGETTGASPLHVLQIMCGALALSNAGLLHVTANTYHMDTETAEKLCAELADVLRVNMIANLRARVFDE
jgi:hypothetical protein